jgi:hypothetical protein
MKLDELKRISELLFGNYEDGVLRHYKLLQQKQLEYLLHPNISRYLVLRNIKKEFKEDIHNHA